MKKLTTALLLSMCSFAFAEKIPENTQLIEENDAVAFYQSTPESPDQLSQFYFIKSKKEGLFASISTQSALQSGAGFAVVPAKNFSDYMKNAEFAKEYLVHCKSAHIIDVANQTSKPISEYKLIHQAAAEMVCVITGEYDVSANE